MNSRTHYFPISGDTVVTAMLSTGRYKAYLTEGDQVDVDVRGYGHSRLAAIADLVEELAKAANQ